MRLVGFTFWGVSDGPLRAGYTPLGDVTALIGVNDSGKSTTLSLLAHALGLDPSDHTAPEEDPLEDADLVVYVVGTPGERDMLLSQVADPEHDPDDHIYSEDPDDQFDAMMGPRAAPRGSIVQLEIDLADQLGETTAELTRAALEATRTFAFQLRPGPDGARRWEVHWCLTADHALASAVGESSLDLGRPRLASEPIALWTLGLTALGVLPRPVLAPRGLSSALEDLVGVLYVLATCIRVADCTDAV